MELTQYQIVLVTLDTTIGSEMKKTRPCIIISPNEINKYLRTIVIAPVTSQSKAYPTRVDIKYGRVRGWIVLDQIRTIDKIRVIKSVGVLTEKEINKIKSVIRETYVE